MGNASTDKIKDMIAKGAAVKPLLWIDNSRRPSQPVRLLDDTEAEQLFFSDKMHNTGINYYRSDDVCATAYFYLDRPANNLPHLPSVELRLKDLKEKVWSIPRN